MNKIEEVLNKKRRFVVFPIVCADHCAHLLKMDLAEVAHDGEKLAAAIEHAYRLYRYDMVLIFCDAYVEAEAMGCEIEFTPYPRIRSDARGSRRMQPATDRTGEIVKAARILKERVDVPVFVSIKGPFTLAAFLAGLDDFLKLLVRDPDRAAAGIDEALRFQLAYVDRLLGVGVDIFVGDPIASGSVIAPRSFERFALPALKTLMTRIKGRGRIGGIHICGDTRSIAAALDECRADILSVEEMTIPARTLKMGGVSTATILSGDRQAIENEIDAALREPYLIVSTSCDVPVATPAENIKAMVDYARIG
jgi:uroporphyrinogen decarboxylase